MGSVSAHLHALKESGEKALIVFVTAGDQSLGELPGLVSALEEGGADLIEIGVPFSDPFGEGPTIQASSQRALERGVTSKSILAAVKQIRAKVPLVTMGYFNTVLRFGVPAYATALADAGVSGSIIQDLTPEESDSWCDEAAKYGLDTIFLAAPTSTPERIDEVCRRSTGFVYAVSRTGVTGAGQEAPPEVAGLVARIKEKTDLPVCVGFGISKPEHVRMVCQVSDGAVVGSALVDLLHRTWDGGKGREAVVDYVKILKAATLG